MVYYYNNLKYILNVIYSSDGKAEIFRSHYSSFECHMILQKSFSCADLLLMLKTVVLLNIFV